MNYFDRNGLSCLPRPSEDELECNRGVSYARSWLLNMERKKVIKSKTSCKTANTADMISKEEHNNIVSKLKEGFAKEILKFQNEKRKEEKTIEYVDIQDDAIAFLLEIYLSGINIKIQPEQFRRCFLQPESKVKLNLENIKNNASSIDEIITSIKKIKSHVITFEQFLYLVSKDVLFKIELPGGYSTNLNDQFHEFFSIDIFKLYVGGEINYVNNYKFEKILETFKKFKKID